MWWLIFSFVLLFNNSYAVVDYWGLTKPKEEKKQEQEKSPEEVLQESIKWYEEKISKEKAPIEVFYFKNPEKYKEAYLKWLQWQQNKVNELVNPVTGITKASYKDYQEILSMFNQRGYELLYFYKPDCPYCNAMSSEIDILQKFIKVHKINVYDNLWMALKWKVYATPTLILVSAKEKKAFRIEGYMPAVEVANNFYEQWKEAK